MVALGIVFSGFLMFSAGILAHSNPRNAYNVITATTGRISKSFWSVKLNSGNISKSKIKNPNRIIKTNGISLAIVVKIWMFPEDLIPFDDVNVKNQINERPVKVA